MNKYLTLGIIGIAIVGIGFLYFTSQDGAQDIESIHEALITLEDELDNLDVDVRTGNLTPEEAHRARARIMEQLEAIQTSGTQGARRGLSEAQRAELQDGLARLVGILETYLVTLSTVDAIAAEIDVADVDVDIPRTYRGRTVLEAVTEVLTELSEAAEIDRPFEEIEPLQEREVGEEDTPSSEPLHIEIEAGAGEREEVDTHETE